MGSCGGEGEIQVVVKRREVVAALLPMQEHWLPMSNLDLLLPPLDVGVFFCYNGNNNRIKMAKKTEEDEELEMVNIVKKGLEEVLVSFYSLAGEVVLNNHGEPELLCNNRGVDFVHAFVDMDLRHLDLHNPDTCIHANFVPLKKHGVLAVQVTEVNCGGILIGCSFDHRVADAHSINMFLVAWADITRSNSIHNSIAPCYRRSLLSPRRPTICHQQATIHNMYVLLASNSVEHPPADPAPGGYLHSRIYHITAHEINRLQSLAGGKRSKLESFSALLWKLLSRGAKNDNKICKLGIVVNGRKYCINETYCDNYFGNVLSIPFMEATVGELKALPLSKIANLVHACVEGAANENHFRGLIDWVEKYRPQQAMSKIYSWKPSHQDEVAVVVSSGQRFPVSRMDFGWGRPDFGSYHFPWGGHTGYVMPMPSARVDGDWLVYMHLLPYHLDLVEKEAPHVFKPFVYI